jgi:hypothetical protein
MRANTICCIVELALNFFEQNLPLPCGAVTFDHSMSANKRMSFRSVITHPDSHFWVEGANRCGSSCLQRIPDNRCEIIGVVTADGHQAAPFRPRYFWSSPLLSASGVAKDEARTGVRSGLLARAGTTTAIAARQILYRTLDLKTGRTLI